MNKKHIFIIVFLIILFITVCALGIRVMDDYQTRIQNEEIFKDAHDFLMTDTSFAEQYGTVTSVDTSPNNDIEYIERGIWHVPCIVSVEKERSYLVWIESDYNVEKFSFISVTELE